MALVGIPGGWTERVLGPDALFLDAAVVMARAAHGLHMALKSGNFGAGDYFGKA